MLSMYYLYYIISITYFEMVCQSFAVDTWPWPRSHTNYNILKVLHLITTSTSVMKVWKCVGEKPSKQTTKY